MTTHVKTEWGIAYDDGDVDLLPHRSACVEALQAIQAGIDSGDYDDADYAGRRIVRRTITSTIETTDWMEVKPDGTAP